MAYFLPRDTWVKFFVSLIKPSQTTLNSSSSNTLLVITGLRVWSSPNSWLIELILPIQNLSLFTSTVCEFAVCKIKNVAKKYLTRDNLSVVILDPQPMNQDLTPKGRPHVH